MQPDADSLRWKSQIVLVITVALLAAACGSAQATNNRSIATGAPTDPVTAVQTTITPTKVKAAMATVGLTRFISLPRSAITADKHVPGVDPSKIQAVLVSNSGSSTGSHVAYTSIIVVVADPSVFDPMKARIAAENVGKVPLTIRYAATENVLVISGFTHPTANQRLQLAKIPNLIHTLRAH